MFGTIYSKSYFRSKPPKALPTSEELETETEAMISPRRSNANAAAV